LSKHGAILSEEVLDLIGTCISIAGENKFEITSPDVSKVANEAANSFYKKLKEAEKIVLQKFHSQAIT
jgi:hypothetical protein